MKTLNVYVSNKVATFSRRDGNIVCGNADYMIRFHFDSEWDGYESKTARFIWGSKHKDVIFSGDTCPVPIVADTERLEIGVYVDGLSTTTSAKIPCKRSVLCSTKTHSEGTVIIPEAPQPILTEKTIDANGTYTPEGNIDGFSKVIVNVPETTGGNSFKGEYDDSVAYKNGDIVTYQGNVYMCGSDMYEGGHNPVAESIYWYGQGGYPMNASFKGEFSWGTAYRVNDIVTNGGGVYLVTHEVDYNAYPSFEYFGWKKLNTSSLEMVTLSAGTYRIKDYPCYDGRYNLPNKFEVTESISGSYYLSCINDEGMKSGTFSSLSFVGTNRESYDAAAKINEYSVNCLWGNYSDYITIDYDTQVSSVFYYAFNGMMYK